MGELFRMVLGRSLKDDEEVLMDFRRDVERSQADSQDRDDLVLTNQRLIFARHRVAQDPQKMQMELEEVGQADIRRKYPLFTALGLFLLGLFGYDTLGSMPNQPAWTAWTSLLAGLVSGVLVFWLGSSKVLVVVRKSSAGSTTDEAEAIGGRLIRFLYGTVLFGLAYWILRPALRSPHQEPALLVIPVSRQADHTRAEEFLKRIRDLADLESGNPVSSPPEEQTRI